MKKLLLIVAAVVVGFICLKKCRQIDSGIEINELNSGCICCSLVGDFAKALECNLRAVKDWENIFSQSTGDLMAGLLFIFVLIKVLS